MSKDKKAAEARMIKDYPRLLKDFHDLQDDMELARKFVIAEEVLARIYSMLGDDIAYTSLESQVFKLVSKALWEIANPKLETE